MKLGSKNKQQQKNYLRIAIGVVFILCLLLAVSVYERFTIEREMAERRAELETEFTRLEERRSALEEKVEYLEDESSIEAEIRRSFDVAREGEQVVIILDDEASATADTASSTTAIPQSPWYIFWR